MNHTTNPKITSNLNKIRQRSWLMVISYGVKTLLRLKTVKLFVATGIAAHYPEPKDKDAFVRKSLYHYHYDKDSEVLNVTYSWPKSHTH